MKLRSPHFLASILTFFIGSAVSSLVHSVGTSPIVPEQRSATIVTAPISAAEANPRGYGFGTGNGTTFTDVDRPTTEEFRNLVTCSDKTIQLVWKELTATKEFWDLVNPSFKNHDCSGMFEALRLDLNGDQVNEIKIRGQYGNHCGATGNCGEWIFGFDQATNEYKLLLQSGGEYFHVWKDTSNGYKNIYITTHDSASSSYHMIYKYSRGRYREAKCWFEEYSIDGSHFTQSCADRDREYEKESAAQ